MDVFLRNCEVSNQLNAPLIDAIQDYFQLAGKKGSRILLFGMVTTRVPHGLETLWLREHGTNTTTPLVAVGGQWQKLTVLGVFDYITDTCNVSR